MHKFVYIGLIIYIIPFFFAVILPAWLIPTIIKINSGIKEKNIPSFFPFTSALIILAIVANILWEKYIYKTIYYEWDRGFLPYTFFWHEHPSFANGSPNWLLPGWQTWHLSLIWAGITLTIYLGSVLFWVLVNKKTTAIGHKIVVKSVMVLALLSSIGFFLNVQDLLLYLMVTVVRLKAAI